MENPPIQANMLPTVRVRLTITPEEHLLSGIYRQLQSMQPERLRANLIRKILSTKEHIPSIPMDNFDETLALSHGTISIRLTISTRDVGIDNLHHALHNATSDIQRRLLIKAELEKIQINAFESLNKSTASTHDIEANDDIEIEIKAKQNQGNQNQISLESDIQQGNRPQAATQTNEVTIGLNIKRDKSFKSRMLNASRMFDI